MDRDMKQGNAVSWGTKEGKIFREVSEQGLAGLVNDLDRYLWNFWLGRLSG